MSGPVKIERGVSAGRKQDVKPVAIVFDSKMPNSSPEWNDKDSPLRLTSVLNKESNENDQYELDEF